MQNKAHADGFKSSIETRNGNVMSRSSFLATLLLIPVVATTMTVPAMAAVTTTTSTSSAADSSTGSTPVANTALQESISGFIAGATVTVSKTVVKYPLDSATVRLQMPNTEYSLRDLAKLLKGSYRGITVPLLANIPAGAVFFAVKDATKAALVSSDAPPWAKTCAAVAAAQIPYWLVRNPSEVVKTRQQAGIEGYGSGVSAVDAYRNVLRDGTSNSASSSSSSSGGGGGGGLQDFYLGYWENIIYAYPADVIKFVCYDAFSKGRKNLSPAEGAMAGAAATAVSQFLTTPLDVVRNRIMTRTTGGTKRPSAEAEEASSPQQSLSYLDTLAQLAREEGLTGLFAGASPRVGKALLSGAIQFATYEEMKQQIAKLFPKS
jgi:hypothetical protein